jgi:glycosyltransferase involved in cell wall biosynthesis
MAAGIPVVSAPAGLAGIDAVPGRDVLAADAPDVFAAHAVSLLRDPDLGERLARSAADFVHRHHQWRPHLDRLERIVSGVAAGMPTNAVA